MEMLQLRYFYESAKSESFAKTAEKYMVPASSVSASVKRLEQELGTTLFDRTSNKIKLNDKGYYLFNTLGEVFDKLDEAVTFAGETTIQTKNISILIKARRKWITELIIEYKKDNPETNFFIYNDVHTSDNRHFDVIIDEKEDAYKDMERFILSVEQICIKASKNNSLVGKKLKFAQLKDRPFVMPRKDVWIRKLLDDTSKRNGFEPNIAIECNDTYCLSKYVKADMGLTLGSRRALKNDVEKDIVSLNIIDFAETQTVYVHHRKFGMDENHIQKFCDFLFKKGQTIEN